MIQEQYYQYQEYHRRQQLLRSYIKAVGIGDSEHQRKENPKKQEDLRDAIGDASIGTVNIADSFVISGNAMEINPGRNLTVNLGFGNMLITQDMQNDTMFTARNGSTLTIDGQGTLDASNIYAPLKMTKSGDDTSMVAKVVIENGTFKGKYAAITGNSSRPNTDLTIEHGNFESIDEDSVAVFQPQDGIMTINGGYFKGGTGIWVKSGTVTINDGEFYGSGISAEYRYSGNGFNSTGDGFVIDNCAYPGGDPSIEINGGHFYSENASPIASYSYNGKEALYGFVKGGFFNKQIDISLVAEGFELTENEHEIWKYKVVPQS